MDWTFVEQIGALFVLTFLFAVVIVEYAIWRSDQ